MRGRIALAAGGVALVFGLGTVLFHWVFGESREAGFYRAAMTAMLTGLDSNPRGAGEQYVTIGLALGGVAIFGYLVAQAVEAVAREVAGDFRREKRRRTMIDELHDHFIICGYGRVGRRAAADFLAAGQPFVVLDMSPQAITEARAHGVLYIEGSGAVDGDLVTAGIDRARGLLASADSDSENVYITLSARFRRQDMMIVARASNEEAERKLLIAGANRVVQPYSSAGGVMAQLALRPQVAAVLDLVSKYSGAELRFEEIEVGVDWTARTLRELRIRSSTGAVVIALRRPDGSVELTPSGDVAIAEGDIVLAIGTAEQLKAVEDMFAPEIHAG